MLPGAPGVKQFVAISRDISAQHMADLAASRSNERLHSILSATADVLWDIDLRNDRVWWGPGMRSVFGYAPDQIGPRTEWCHAHIHPEDRERVVDSMTSAVRDGDVTWEGEFRYRKADGQYLDVLDRGSILRGSSGEALRFVGVMQDITKRKAAAGRQETLTREFAHRVNNTLAVVQGIFYQTKSYCSDLDTFAEKFTARILALAAANRVVAHNASGADLGKLATEQLAAFIGEGRVTIGGPEAMLDTELVQALALVLNELATNAMKYGSLSSSRGHASLTWRYERRHGEEVLAIRWVESGGPPVRTPGKSGLGSKLIDEAIQGAEVQRDFNAAGFSCSIVLPRRVLEPFSSVENVAAAS
jgi:PAS domain S-box-containing protein